MTKFDFDKLNLPNLTVDTGAPRNVTGHIISGALASGAVASGINYNKYKSGEVEKNKAINDSVKLTVQGGIATGSAIAAANYIGKGNWLGMLGAVALGAAGIYASEKIAQTLEDKAKHMHISDDETVEVENIEVEAE